jgi:triosephosphate isomerase
MNLDRSAALALVGALRERCKRTDLDVGVCPPFVYIESVASKLVGSRIQVGGQDLCAEASGAHTGEVSGAMLRDVGAQFSIIGHSERRALYGEGDELINRKVQAALAAGLAVILCVGETLEQRRGGATNEVVLGQLRGGLRDLDAGAMARMTIAYEPVWAIGTGVTASPGQAGEVHALLREELRECYGGEVANSVRIQYGGSVKPDNVDELMSVPDIDGALVGGASLSADSFLRIVAFQGATQG